MDILQPSPDLDFIHPGTPRKTGKFFLSGRISHVS